MRACARSAVLRAHTHTLTQFHKWIVDLVSWLFISHN